MLALLIAADEPFSVFEANCQCFTNRPLIGIITKIDSPYANVPMVRNWMINSGCERIFEVSSLTREGIQDLIDYLKDDPVKLTLEEAKDRQSHGIPEWIDPAEWRRDGRPPPPGLTGHIEIWYNRRDLSGQKAVLGPRRVFPPH